MRTRESVAAGKKLSELNTHYSLSALVFQEFADDLKEDEPLPANLVTKDRYPSNSKAALFNVPVNKLAEHVQAYETLLCQLFVSRTSEILKTYFSGITAFLEALQLDHKTVSTGDSFFEQLAAKAGCDISTLLGNELIWTANHLRLRRNCIVHRNTTASSAFEDMCRQHGTALNRFWENKLPSCTIDFRSPDAGGLTPGGMIYLFRATRFLIEKVDENLATIIPLQKLEVLAREEFNFKINCKNLTSERVHQRFRTFCRVEFDWKIE